METDIKQKIEDELGFKLIRGTNLIDNQKEKDDFILDKLSHMRLDLKVINKVEELILKALRLDPKSELFWASLGYVYYIKGEFSKSIKCFFKTIEMNPVNVDNWIDLGFAYRAYGDTKASDFIFLNCAKMIEVYCEKFNKIDSLVLFEIIRILESR